MNHNDDDTTMTKNGVSLLIDAMSYQYLVGAEIDYKGRPARRTVCDQEPERYHHLWLRFQLLCLTRPRSLQKGIKRGKWPQKTGVVRP